MRCQLRPEGLRRALILPDLLVALPVTPEPHPPNTPDAFHGGPLRPLCRCGAACRPFLPSVSPAPIPPWFGALPRGVLTAPTIRSMQALLGGPSFPALDPWTPVPPALSICLVVPARTAPNPTLQCMHAHNVCSSHTRTRVLQQELWGGSTHRLITQHAAYAAESPLNVCTLPCLQERLALLHILFALHR